MPIPELSPRQIVLLGILASTAAGLATGVGALPGLYFRDLTRRALDSMLGFAAGIMLAATCFSLIVPGIGYGQAIYGSTLAAVAAMVVGILFGAVFLDRLDKWLPHEHFVKDREGPSTSLKKTWLFIIAIMLHNFPEGLAVFLPLLREGYGRGRALWIATATGLVEPVGGLLGASLVTVFRPLLPLGMAFAAGAMLFVISDEIIPETHRGGNERAATFGIIVGFVVMMALDNLVG